MANRTASQQRRSRGAQSRCRSAVSNSVYFHLQFHNFLQRFHFCHIFSFCFFQRSFVWSFRERSKQAMLRPPPSMHLHWLDKRRRWRFSRLRKTTLKGKSSEDRKALIQSHSWCFGCCVLNDCELFVFQPVGGGGGCFVFLLRHSESFPLHDRGWTQAAGEETVIRVKIDPNLLKLSFPVFPRWPFSFRCFSSTVSILECSAGWSGSACAPSRGR